MEIPTQQFGPVTVYFGEKNGKYPDGNQVIVTGADMRVGFDTPLLAHRAPQVLDGVDLLMLGHAHEDHTAGLGMLPDAPLLAPEQDLAAVQSVEGMLAHYGYSEKTTEEMRHFINDRFHFKPRPDATGYADGHTLDLGGGVRIRAIHAPGHTRGHSILMVEPGNIAFIGDIDLSSFGPYYGDGCSDLTAFMRTLDEIEHMEASTWITFHHKGVISDRETFLHLLRAFREKAHQRARDIVQFIAEGGAAGRTVDEMVAHRFLYPKDYQVIYLEDVERYTINGHLELLTAGGQVARDGARYYLP